MNKGDTEMTKTFAVHYGREHIARCAVLARNFRSLETAKKAAAKLLSKGYEIVIIADTDGNEWNMAS
jgi:hypothetical protein